MKDKTIQFNFTIFGLLIVLCLICIDNANAQYGGYGQNPYGDNPVVAYLKWAAKTIEILGFTYCGGYLLGFIAALLQKRWVVSALLFFLMPVSFLGGAITELLYKGLIAYTVNSEWAFLALLFCIIHSLISFVWFIAIGFLPTIVAFRREHKDKVLLFKLNFLGFIPLVWPILLYLAYGEEEETD